MALRRYFAPISQNKKDSTVAEDRPLHLVREFNKENANTQYGWQMVDDTTVLERKKIPVCVFSNSDNEPWAVWIRMYDFNAAQVLNYVQQCYDASARTPEMSVMSFSQIENPQCIADAHRALRELGGQPPALEDVLPNRPLGKPGLSRKSPGNGR